MNTHRKPETLKGRHVIDALRPRTGSTATPPNIGDIWPTVSGSRRHADLQIVRDIITGDDDRAPYSNDGGEVAYFLLISELNGSKTRGYWMPYPANYDAIRIPLADYITKHTTERTAQ